MTHETDGIVTWGPPPTGSTTEDIAMLAAAEMLFDLLTLVGSIEKFAPDTSEAPAWEAVQLNLRDRIAKVYGHEMPDNGAKMKLNRFIEIDRNARAYGFEIGRGRPLSVKVETSDDNPFMDPKWRERLV